MTLPFLSLTSRFLCLYSRWSERREIPRRRPPPALPIPIPLSRGSLPPPAPLPRTGHGHLPPEPPPEEDTLWPRHNLTCRCVWPLSEALTLLQCFFFFLYFFLVFPWCRCRYCSHKLRTAKDRKTEASVTLGEGRDWTMTANLLYVYTVLNQVFSDTTVKRSKMS